VQCGINQSGSPNYLFTQIVFSKFYAGRIPAGQAIRCKSSRPAAQGLGAMGFPLLSFAQIKILCSVIVIGFCVPILSVSLSINPYAWGINVCAWLLKPATLVTYLNAWILKSAALIIYLYTWHLKTDARAINLNTWHINLPSLIINPYAWVLNS